MSLTKVSSAVLNVDDLYGFRNRIINGDMRIDQRNAGAAVTAAGNFPVDRFNVILSSDTAGFSAQQDSSAPSGFSNSTKITITATDNFTGVENLSFTQRIEGYNIADLAWGTASAQPVTVSFWARSSVTGTHGGVIRNSVIDRSYPFSYTISSADTWEYKTIVVDGETSGSWGNSNDFGLMLRFCLGAGSDRLGTAGVWANSSLFGTTGQVNLAATNGATFYITGVQLEAGTVATPFERRPYGTELALCQRYLPVISGNTNRAMGTGTSSTTVGSCVFTLHTQARVPPTGIVISDIGHFRVGDVVAISEPASAITFQSSGVNNVRVSATIASSFITLARPTFLFSNSADALIYFTGCEL
jgi:hypothetical protein